MNLKEIVHCYVSDTVPVPTDMKTLRDSFIANGFNEKVISQNKYLFKRGAALALEFNYNSDAIEMQVILEKKENHLKISVGNWGFPFEPLLMKNRFQSNLEAIVEQINSNSVLEANKSQAEAIEKNSNKKFKAAVVTISLAILASLIYSYIKTT